jgi:hypothetical protein
VLLLPLAEEPQAAEAVQVAMQARAARLRLAWPKAQQKAQWAAQLRPKVQVWQGQAVWPPKRLKVLPLLDDT